MGRSPLVSTVLNFSSRFDADGSKSSHSASSANSYRCVFCVVRRSVLRYLAGDGEGIGESEGDGEGIGESEGDGDGVSDSDSVRDVNI